MLDHEGTEIIEETLIPSLEALPFVLVHGTPKGLMEKLHAFAEPLGYSLAKELTKAHRLPQLDANVGTMDIKCSKGHKIRAPKGKKQKRSSRMTECPFQLIARGNRGTWTLKL
ncbi:hypothetical protein K3495_g7815 [Podosphaera aphanis]|nr:hypothetical protein K3495_g7815 [Podosphaera aphanis]